MELQNMNLVSLDKHELVEIDGGKPSTETSLAYDIGWWAMTILIALGEGASKVKG